MTDIAQKKKEIRNEILDKRDKLSEAEQKKASILITERILGHQLFYSSDIVLGFVSFGSEIDTTEIIKEADRLHKKVYIPQIAGEQMLFFRFTSFEDLSKGYKGILEPKGDTEQFVYQEEMQKHIFMLMPGVAFDCYRNRLGYGKGFYDQYLQDKMSLSIRTIAIGHKCQMVEEIPTFEKDIKPGQIICV